jgi:hypothetical protein
MRLRNVLFGLAALAAVACGGPGKTLVPVDSPLNPWTPPEAEEPAAEEGAPAPAPAAEKPEK